MCPLMEEGINLCSLMLSNNPSLGVPVELTRPNSFSCFELLFVCNSRSVICETFDNFMSGTCRGLYTTGIFLEISICKLICVFLPGHKSPPTEVWLSLVFRA